MVRTEKGGGIQAGAVQKRKNWVEDIVMYILIPLLTAGTVVGILYTQLPFWLRLTLAVVTGVMGAGAVIFRILRWLKTYKLLFVGLVMLFVLLLVYLFLERTGFMAVFNVDRDIPNKKAVIQQRLQQYLQSKGNWASFIYVLLQFAQTTILPLPAFAVTGAGSLLFTQMYGPAMGPLYNSLLSLAGILIGSLASFFAGRIFGYRLVAWIVGKEPLKKALELIKGRDTVVLTLMFVLPFFPDDVLCFVAGLSSMGTWYFIVMMTISRILVVFCTSYVVGLIPFTTWWGLTIWGALFVLTAVLFVVAFKKGKQIDAFFRRKFAGKMRHKRRGDGFDFAQDLIDKLDKEIREEAAEERLPANAVFSGHKKK